MQRKLTRFLLFTTAKTIIPRRNRNAMDQFEAILRDSFTTASAVAVEAIACSLYLALSLAEAWEVNGHWTTIYITFYS